MRAHSKPVQKSLKMSSKKGSIKVKKPKVSKIKKKDDIKKKGKKLNIKEMTADDFLSGGFEDIDVDNSDVGENSSGSSFSGIIQKETPVKKNKSVKESKQNKKGKNLKNKKKCKLNGNETSEKKNSKKIEESSNENSDEESDDEIFTDHKKQLNNLKNTDPEFYEYLKENDGDLLNFDDSDLDSDDSEKDENVHVAPEKLEIASDEEDYEAEDDELTHERADNVVTLKKVENWQNELKGQVSSKLIRDVVEAFHAAVVRVSADDEVTPSAFKVDGSSVFNAIVRMCIVDLEPAVRKFLNLSEKDKIIPSQIKSWRKVKTPLHNYFTDLTELSGVTSPSMLSVLLKHIHRMTPFILCFPSISQKVLKRVIFLWASDDDVVRVLSFLCALKLANHRRSLLKPALKSMYLTYVKNTKFISPSTLPGVNFMRQSLAEMFALDDTTSYQMAFLYIRQLAIHLRNAITLRKKESYQAVYNWQFISSIQLWAEVFGLVAFNSPLHSLIYPLIQITIGTIKLIPSSQYYPLRFHCCKILITLAEKTGIFIPVLPFLLEVLKDFDFNREHKKVSMKPMELSFVLRCSKTQMKENGFKDSLIENINSLLMHYLAIESHRLSFLDVLVPAVMQIKQFSKTCRNANYNKKMKAILDKVLENSKFIEGERKKHTIKLSDVQGIEAIEAQIKANGTPFLTYYNNWKKVHMQQQAIKATDNKKIGDYKLPVLYKNSKKRSREESEPVGPPELFPSDDEEDDVNFGDSGSEEDNNSETEMEPEPRAKKQKTQKRKKEPKKQVQKGRNSFSNNNDEDEEFGALNEEDIVEDLNLSDLE